MVRFLSVLLWLLLTGCAEFPIQLYEKPQKAAEAEMAGPPAPSSLALDQAQQLTKKGNWVHAIQMLEEARSNYPGNQDVAEALAELQTSWKEEKRLLEDRMLVIELSALQSKMPLLEKLAVGDPENELYQSRLRFWKQYLQSKVNPLIGCGLYHRKRDLWLSSKCLQLADGIRPTSRTKNLLADVASKIEQQKQASIDRKHKRADRRRARQLKSLLQEAEKDMARGAYSNALVKLDEAQRRAPADPQVRELMEKVQTTVSLQVESLMELGDRLYREEQIGPAVAVWESALELDPDHEQISEKIDRARRVLEKLESIRSRPDGGE